MESKTGNLGYMIDVVIGEMNGLTICFDCVVLSM